MPASIVHMLVSKKVRRGLKDAPEFKNNSKFMEFIEDILEKNYVFMELGSLGPDLPYYSGMNLFWAFWNSFWQRHDMPAGVEQWSYQLHGLTTNIFPIKMIETLFQDRPLEKEAWADDDKKKFAFICGYLTHMAADQIIHPIINLIAGPYYKKEEARTTHRDCEVTQDLYLYDKEQRIDNFHKESFSSWCDINKISDYITLLRFRYLIQRAFLETYYVAPSEDNIEHWVKGALAILSASNGPVGPYKEAIKNLSVGTPKYNEYIELRPPQDATDIKKEQYKKIIGDNNYNYFVDQATELGSIYVKATFRIYDDNFINKRIEEKFKNVVSDADLSSPLDENILQKSKTAYEGW